MALALPQKAQKHRITPQSVKSWHVHFFCRPCGKVTLTWFRRHRRRARISHDSHFRFERSQLLLLPKRWTIMSASTIPCASLTSSSMDSISPRRFQSRHAEATAARATRRRPAEAYIYGYLNGCGQVGGWRPNVIATSRYLAVANPEAPTSKPSPISGVKNRTAFKPCFASSPCCARISSFSARLLAWMARAIKAVNNKDKNFTRNSLEKFIKAVDERLEEYLKRLDEGDVRKPERTVRASRILLKRSRRCQEAWSLRRAAGGPREKWREPDIADRLPIAGHGGAYEGWRRLQYSDRG